MTYFFEFSLYRVNNFIFDLFLTRLKKSSVDRISIKKISTSRRFYFVRNIDVIISSDTIPIVFNFHWNSGTKLLYLFAYTIEKR